MNPRYQRMIKGQHKRLFYAWLGQAIVVVLLLLLAFFTILKTLEYAADRPCVTASPAYAQEIGCGK